MSAVQAPIGVGDVDDHHDSLVARLVERVVVDARAERGRFHRDGSSLPPPPVHRNPPRVVDPVDVTVADRSRTPVR